MIKLFLEIRFHFKKKVLIEQSYNFNTLSLRTGIDQTNNSGYLSCKKITKDDLWLKTYSRLFQRLATTTYEIPIGNLKNKNHYN